MKNKIHDFITEREQLAESSTLARNQVSIIKITQCDSYLGGAKNS